MQMPCRPARVARCRVTGARAAAQTFPQAYAQFSPAAHYLGTPHPGVQGPHGRPPILSMISVSTRSQFPPAAPASQGGLHCPLSRVPAVSTHQLQWWAHHLL